MWTIKRHILPILLACAATLAGCTESKLVVDQAKVITNPGPAKPGPYKIGKPYQVNGIWYYPKADYRYSETGIASWYGPGFHGKRTANGEIYDENGLTAAHKTLPMPAMVRVTNLENGRSIQVRVNDRGPFEAGRIIDMTRRGAQLLGFIERGHGAGARRHHAGGEPATGRARLAPRRGPDAAAAQGRAGRRSHGRRPGADRGVQGSPGTKPSRGQAPTGAGRAAGQPDVAAIALPQPDGKVTQFPVKPTNIYIQAGAFLRQANANQLSGQLKKYGPVRVAPVQVERQRYLPRPHRPDRLGRRGRQDAEAHDRRRASGIAHRGGLASDVRRLALDAQLELAEFPRRMPRFDGECNVPASRDRCPSVGLPPRCSRRSLRPSRSRPMPQHVYIVDFQTGSVLYDKMGEERLHPASMSKLMTVYMLFDAMKRGDVKLTDTFHVSQKAWAMQGSKMFVDIDSDVKVEDLIRGMIIQSGNDACIVVAEGLAGSEEAFADRMNAKGKEIGLTGSNFTNSTGWPDDNHYMTAKDIATLSRRLITRLPGILSVFRGAGVHLARHQAGQPQSAALSHRLRRRRPEDRPYGRSGLRHLRIGGARRTAHHHGGARPDRHAGARRRSGPAARLGVPRDRQLHRGDQRRGAGRGAGGIWRRAEPSR